MQGQGTFVTRPKFEQLLSLTSFEEAMRQRGLRPGWRTLSIATAAASRSVARALALTENNDIIALRRLRLTDDEPIALDMAYLPLARFPDLLATDLTDCSLYELIQERYDIVLTHAEQTIEPTLLGEEEARLLGCAPWLPAFLMERVSCDRFDRPVELARSLFRGDRYKLHAHLDRRDHRRGVGERV
jgi:GntR family transcriptional regulator